MSPPATPDPGPTHMDAATLRELLGSTAPPRVVDVRTPAEFETAHIPGAYNVPLDTLREHRNEFARHLDEDVVLVCRSGTRAAQAHQALAETGLPHLRVLDGGTSAWEHSGAAMTRGRPRWDLERQVRLAAGSIVLAAIVGSRPVPQLKWVAGFVGAGLTFAAISNTCGMARVLGKLPYNRSSGADTETLITQLATTRSGG